ncbi:galectin-3b [Antennarius striatus]|uniref:galectin-3b n=1 Tax=Antennarius striatus TaxID=241820 RepID=UPI0035AF577F
MFGPPSGGGGSGHGGPWQDPPSGGSNFWQSNPDPSNPPNQYNPSNQPDPYNQPNPQGPSYPSGQSRNMSVPYQHPLPNGLYDRVLITIRGTINPNPHRFAVDLCASNDIAFHMNPRFNEAGKKVIVMNSSIGNSWGSEEREWNYFPFEPRRDFTIEILCSNHDYTITIDRRQVHTFRHRISNLRSIGEIKIRGDLTLQDVRVEMKN